MWLWIIKLNQKSFIDFTSAINKHIIGIKYAI